MRNLRAGMLHGGKRGFGVWLAIVALSLGLTLFGTGCNEVISREVRQGVLDVVTQSVSSVSSGLSSGLSTAISNALP